MIRPPAVANQFYPADPSALKKLIRGMLPKTTHPKEKAIACILPHAGYIYSGKVAASVLSILDVAPTCVVIGPNHTGYGVPASIISEGTWRTPLGDVPINHDLAGKIIKNSRYLEDDEMAHAYEHSIEVELPLIQEICRADFSLVPIVLASGDDLVYKDVAHAIAAAVRETAKPVTIIASSDMTHYESQERAQNKDAEAIRAILELDDRRLLETVDRLRISMCGYLPAAVAIASAKSLGAISAKLVAYQTSGETTGDFSSVVGYAGILIA